MKSKGRECTQAQCSDLLRQIGKGNVSAFDKLIFYYRPAIFEGILAIVHCRFLAREIAAEIFREVWLTKELGYSYESFKKFVQRRQLAFVTIYFYCAAEDTSEFPFHLLRPKLTQTETTLITFSPKEYARSRAIHPAALHDFIPTIRVHAQALRQRLVTPSLTTPLTIAERRGAIMVAQIILLNFRSYLHALRVHNGTRSTSSGPT